MHGQDGLAQKAHQAQGTVASGATTSQALWTMSSQRGREAGAPVWSTAERLVRQNIPLPKARRS